MSSPINALGLAASVAGLVFLSAAVTLRASTPQASEAPYRSEIDAAMMRMHAGMAVQPTGDVDADFVAMMISHHQGAIDMARASALPSGDGSVSVWAFRLEPYPASSA